MEKCTLRCPYCGAFFTGPVSAEEIVRWFHKGTNVDVGFPKLTFEERTVIATGMCYGCQNKKGD